MNVSSANVTTASYRDSLPKAVIKNVIVVALGISINYINASLIHISRKHQIFYTNPRYILFIHLVVNDMIQLTLTAILFLLSYIVNKINASICCVLILIALFATENTPLNLACMAVERYIAICVPLCHTQICTVKRTLLLIAVIWLRSLCSVLPDLFVTLATESLSFFKSQVFCLRETIFPNHHLIKKRDYSHIAYLIIISLTIAYTYFRIMFTAKAADNDTKKARNTILLHGVQLVLCMGTYVTSALSNAVRQWFPKSFADSLFAGYIIVQILPRSISPIIYGVRDSTLRRYLRKHFVCKRST